MAFRKLFTRIRHAILGAPQTHEQAKAQHEAMIAVSRSRAVTENRGSAASIVNQTHLF